MRTQDVLPYYEILRKKKVQLFLKRNFDVLVSSIMLFCLSPVFLALAIAIKLDSSGPVFFRQVRVTQYGREFRIHKFRSMVDNADKKGTSVTAHNDVRITKVGRFIRDYKLDELAQFIDVWLGNMTFVGTRPEVPKYVSQYTTEMWATLLLPAGITSTASVTYKNEEDILARAIDVDKTYIEKVLPAKMQYNLQDIKEFSIWRDIQLMWKTFFAVV
ncbi:MAG: sugar transferase [Acidaminococcaceae bacterium]|nr:sugar transferase [Acidaminococcaceae bacterium]